ncbi:hypothetical protein P4200_22450 [Pseudomonas aeruginosa]|nr:hypothetical protein [Pseudomonas aeruginosa]
MARPTTGLTARRPSLSAGNPINIATGNKYQSETDYAGPAIAPLLRFTSSLQQQQRTLDPQPKRPPHPQSHMVTLHREDGRTLDFIRLYDRITSQAEVTSGRLRRSMAAGATTNRAACAWISTKPARSSNWSKPAKSCVWPGGGRAGPRFPQPLPRHLQLRRG